MLISFFSSQKGLIILFLVYTLLCCPSLYSFFHFFFPLIIISSSSLSLSLSLMPTTTKTSSSSSSDSVVISHIEALCDQNKRGLETVLEVVRDIQDQLTTEEGQQQKPILPQKKKRKVQKPSVHGCISSVLFDMCKASITSKVSITVVARAYVMTHIPSDLKKNAVQSIQSIGELSLSDMKEATKKYIDEHHKEWTSFTTAAKCTLIALGTIQSDKKVSIGPEQLKAFIKMCMGTFSAKEAASHFETLSEEDAKAYVMKNLWKKN